MSGIFLYNTLSRTVEKLQPVEAGRASVYACGPTVYWFAHIGNMRAYLFVDVLHRVLKENDLAVKLVMNITDVGHLTDDADAGEDKMIVAMKREGKSAYDIAEFYAQAFFDDLKKLNILPAGEYPRATAHIAEQIAMIEKLEQNGFTYRTSDGVYFDTSKLADYGRLSGQRAEEKLAGARIEMGKKKNATDFALWKFSSSEAPTPPNPPSGRGGIAPKGKRAMEWESPWGIGFPGWHIECSAMSAKYLPVPFDIHTGGVDHIAVHHENEIAQTRGANGKLEANIWMHGEFLTVDNGKMSKSLGNLYTVSDLVAHGYDPLAFRYLCLGAHYRTKLNFTFEALDGAQNALNHLRDIVRGWDKPEIGCAEYEQKFEQAINNDLNIPEALAILWKLMDDSDLPTGAKAQTVLKFDRVFGLGLDRYVATPLMIPDNVQQLVAQRETARQNKNWAQSDELRRQIEEHGFLVEDTKDGAKLRERA